MNPITRNYDFMMSSEDKEQYVCPVLMDGYIDTTDSQIRSANINKFISTTKYFIKQGANAVSLMLFGAVVTTGAIAIIAKIIGFSI